jgi:hypothetical protein
METLTKLETAAALSAVTAVLDSSADNGISVGYPLWSAQKKLEANLEEFNASPS